MKKKTKEIKQIEKIQSPILEIKEYNPLANFSDGELQQELTILQKEVARRQEVKRNLEHQAMVERQQVIYKHIDALLELAPHSCSDKIPCNPYDNDCVRCWLLYVKVDAGIYDNRELTFQIKEN